MRTLTDRRGDDWRPAAPAGAVRVLPRILRRPARILAALAEGRLAAQPRTWAVAVVALCAAAGAYSMTPDWRLEAIAGTLARAAGFTVESIEVTGHAETPPANVVRRLKLDDRSSLIALDLDAARIATLSMPWVRDAELHKVYPNSVKVRITEHRPFGIWQHGRQLSLIASDGEVIAPLDARKFAGLSLYVGPGAPVEARALAEALDRWPALKSRVRAHIRIAERRWNLRLDNGVTVLLPESGIARALDRLRHLETQHDLLARDIETIDLRLGDRIAIGLGETALARRQAALKARSRAKARRERG